MILKRYLNREVFMTSLVVMLFLIMMTMGSWLIRYFGMAAQGKLAFAVVFELLLYQVPLLLEFILPLSFFIGLMLTFGRQYVEHEITIIKSAGLSPANFAKLLLPLITCLFLLQAAITLYAKPAGLYAAERLKAEQAIKSAFDLVKPKAFVSINQYSLYVGSFSADKRSLQDIVMIERHNKGSTVIIAKQANQVAPADISFENNLNNSAKPSPQNTSKDHTNAKNINATQKNVVTQLDLYHGRRYELNENQVQYNKVAFKQYRFSISLPNKHNNKATKLEAQSSLSLFKRLPEKTALAELGYRLSLPFAILLAVILALPLSYVQPRQGRWVRLLPAILLFATSVLILNSLKGSIIKGKLPVFIYWLVLAAYALFGTYLYHKRKVHDWLSRHILAKFAGFLGLSGRNNSSGGHT